CQKYSSPPYTF
nr:immunoglobulin light chain junction region [Macaca mulatta]MOV37085.1 immunoglobulin light chain junction region [Macaca mulatta]MOV37345.1 immunoglobulin light chain junction region [Macaca mulatta]MOW34000.1 immunoglobulin light chain junction region [Macaca mulatta]MOW34088.1 immunoglobulin light chain junction region [Macaca mulatta]